jgi:hypothetical protein
MLVDVSRVMSVKNPFVILPQRMVRGANGGGAAGAGVLLAPTPPIGLQRALPPPAQFWPALSLLLMSVGCAASGTTHSIVCTCVPFVLPRAPLRRVGRRRGWGRGGSVHGVVFLSDPCAVSGAGALCEQPGSPIIAPWVLDGSRPTSEYLNNFCELGQIGRGRSVSAPAAAGCGCGAVLLNNGRVPYNGLWRAVGFSPASPPSCMRASVARQLPPARAYLLCEFARGRGRDDGAAGAGPEGVDWPANRHPVCVPV